MPSPVVVVCVPGWLRTHSELLSAAHDSSSQVLKSQVCTTSPGFSAYWRVNLGFMHARQALTLPTEPYSSVKLRRYDRLALFQDLILKNCNGLATGVLDLHLGPHNPHGIKTGLSQGKSKSAMLSSNLSNSSPLC